MDDARVADFLSSLPEEKRKLTEIIRRTVLQADKKVEETIKWGNLTFVKNGKNLAFIYTYDKGSYINFGFLKATPAQRPKRTFSRNRKRHATCKDLFGEGHRQKAIYCLGERSGAIRS